MNARSPRSVWSSPCWAWLLLLALQFCGTDATSARAADPAEAPEIPTALRDYVGAPDDSYAWSVQSVQTLPHGLGKLHQLELTSQTWQQLTWKHQLAIFEPADLEFKDHALLFITGGSTDSKLREGDLRMGAELARLTRARCALLLQVPNQPLLGDRVEDDLITETFLKYIETRDATWPLLFPMVKSAVRAMDAIDAYCQQEQQHKIDKFVVTGASKRGWTTWLTAVADPRVQGIAPIVIDTLNFPKQTRYQLAIWGDYSVQIQDYTSKGLVETMENRPDIPLWGWVDPYTYRKALSLPKLLINGTNDPYWVLDAMNNYWDDLPGQKHVLYVPNAGHSLNGGRENAIRTIAAFNAHITANQPLPKLQWKQTDHPEKLHLEVSAESPPKAVLLWTAHAEQRDFRDSTWKATPLKAGADGSYAGSIAKPETGNVALFAELQFEFQKIPYSLCTQIATSITTE